YLKENYGSNVPTATASTSASAMSNIPTTLVHDTSTLTETITQDVLDVSTISPISGDIPHYTSTHNIAGGNETLIDDLNLPTASNSILSNPITSALSNNVSANLMHNTNTSTTAPRKTLSEDVSNICAGLSTIRTSSTREIFLDDEVFDPTWIQSVGYELREEAQNQKIVSQTQRIIGLENHVKSLINQRDHALKQRSELERNMNSLSQKYNETLTENSDLKETVGRMHYENEVLQAKNEVLQAEKWLLDYDVGILKKKLGNEQ
ncbi:11154_t:CDS:1, partial [Racocetra fulgida]